MICVCICVTLLFPQQHPAHLKIILAVIWQFLILMSQVISFSKYIVCAYKIHMWYLTSLYTSTYSLLGLMCYLAKVAKEKMKKALQDLIT